MTDHVIAASVELKKIYYLLAADVEEARRYGQSNPSDFARRTLARTYFALIEGLSFQFRQVALRCGESAPGLLTHEEMTLLRQQKYKLNAKGEPEASPDFQRLLPNMLFSMKCYAKAFGAEFEPDTANHGFGALRDFVAFRNGLEHPKAEADLLPTDVRLRQSIEAATWWKTNVLRLLEACRQADEYWQSKLS